MGNEKKIPNATEIFLCQRHIIIIELPRVLYGQLLVFQRFSRDNNGPDCAVTLASQEQWSDDNDIPTGYLWMDCAGERTRRLDVYLSEHNDLVIAIYNHESDGRYKISLNGETIATNAGLDTRASVNDRRSWVQFGNYWSGIMYNATDNRQAQIDSGETVASFVYRRFEKYSYASPIDFDLVQSFDPNLAGGFTCP